MRILLLGFIALLLAACATTRGYQQFLDGWIGGNEKALLESNWGIPDKTFQQDDGNKIFCYKAHRVESTPMQVYTNPEGNTTVYGGTTYVRSCETCFYLNRRGIIYHYTFKGNDCLAREQR